MRERPPSLPEQHAELRRQYQMKHLAAAADARWAAKPRVMEAPPGEAWTGQPLPALESRVARRGVGEGEETRKDAIASGEEQVKEQAQENRSGRAEAETEDPWKKQRRAGPSEDWQPQAWAPPASKR